MRLASVVCLLLLAAGARAADPFADTVLPFLNTYCAGCHNAKKASGELDLSRYPTAAAVAGDFRQWEHVVTFLKKEEMPPAKARQPSAKARADVLAALDQVLRTEARKLAGDPGVVPPRRLTNAEYDYSVRDLTGQDVRPAQAFPVDPASGEGFTNTGEALTMSPALFKKYYAAAEFVADHALLTTNGLAFAPHPAVTFADRQKFYEQAILRFYDRHAVDYETYFSALWGYRHRPAARQKATVEEWATEAGLSPKYLRSLWEAVQPDGGKDPFLMAWLRKRWGALPPPSAPAGDLKAAVKALSADIQRLSKELCPKETEAIVANAGNGPIEHLDRRARTAESRDTFDPRGVDGQKLTWTFKNPVDKPSVKIVIQAAGAGDAKADGYVILNGSTFTSQDARADGSRKWTLRALLSEFAPEQMTELKFGTHPAGDKIDADALVLKVPAVVEIDIPSQAFPQKGKGSITFTADGKLDRSTDGIALVRTLDRKPADGDTPPMARPLVAPGHPAAERFAASGAAFCKLFPNRFVYVDPTRGLSAGFHLIEGFFRDDRPLCKSVLTDAEKAELDRLWAELYFVTGIWEKFLRGFVFFERSERNFLKHKDFDPFKEEDPELVKDETLVRFKEVYLRRSNVKATGEALAKHPINVFFEDVRAGLRWQAETLKRAEPIYLKDLLAFAEKAYRRPLTDRERQKLETFYAETCRDKDQGVEAAVRATLVRILVSPYFCYRLDPAPAGASVAPLPDLALASRLSYFLWSSLPDAELLAAAKAGKLRDEHGLKEQVHRMLKDPKASRFAREFFGQWLGYRDFLTRESVNRQVFPAFDDALKQAMFEEPTRLITHLIQTDRPITELLDGDTTLVNARLAKHYGLPFRGTGDDWEVADGLHGLGRGGVLGMAVVLTQNSQPQRTSPVKRGFWVVHKLLGEHIPPPPPDVAVLPAKETDTNGKTIRQLLARHTEDTKCASCHRRFDPVGLAMEGFDPIGRSRSKDLAGRPIDNAVELPDGKEARGVPEFGKYLAAHRKVDFARTLCHKFLGYALGRSLQLSDQPLVEKMQADLAAGGYRMTTLFDLVVTSPQFRTQRCRDFTPDKFQANTQGAER